MYNRSKNVSHLRSVGILFLAFAAFACTRSHRQTTPPEWEGGKPYETFFMQRAYPADQFPVEAYLSGMQAATRAAYLRSARPPGFDEPWENPIPPNFSGRVNAVAVHPNNESIIYAGLASGGLFKTMDGGNSWFPIFDDQAYLAIGSIALDPSNPEIVYVGTGDPNVTGYPFLGDGLYRSTDGGKNWEYLGLRETRIISTILVHPTNPSILWAGCLGLPMDRTQDRGVYKSVDGGKTWKQTLFTSNQAGVTDMVLDPFNPNNVYVAFWDRIRTNRESILSGVNGRVFRSEDGGSTWSPVVMGNAAVLGRIALAHSGVTPGRVFARVVGSDQELDNIYRSDDSGKTWSPVIDWSSTNLGRTGALGSTQFGWYFGKFAVNPKNDFEIYLLGIDLWRTRNGGRNWELAAPSWRQYVVHADKHDLVFSKSGMLYLATDGGLYGKTETADSWKMLGALPGLQFFRVGYNPHRPDIYYGGTQDNGTLQSSTLGAAWKRVYPNDGFTTHFDPIDPNGIYVQMQYGRKFYSGNSGASWTNANSGILDTERSHWDTPFLYSTHQPGTMYTGTYRVYKSSGTKVPTWKAISPDLTDGNIYGNAFHTISALSESPKDSNLLYAGTTDGNLWRSANAGGFWTPIQAGLPNRYITSVHASPDIAEYVYVSFSGYRDNVTLPYIFRSKNKGTTWENISGDLPPIAVNDLLVLKGHKDSIVFAATDAGVYATKNGGQQWHRLGRDFPQVAVYDLTWNSAWNTLLAGSFGRSIFTYDLHAFLNAKPVANKETFRLENALECYPNPVRDVLYIRWSGFPGKVGKLQIYATTGQVVWSTEVALSESRHELTLPNLPVGTYILSLQGGGVNQSKLFIKS